MNSSKKRPYVLNLVHKVFYNVVTKEKEKVMDAFEKIIGYEEEKKILKRTAFTLKNEDALLKMGIKRPRAIMLYGKPGTGKTTMAKAFIKELGWASIVCRKDKPNGEFVDKIKSVFDKAKEIAPCVIFLDDMDKFAEGYSGNDPNKEEYVTIQSCMDDCEQDKIFIIATVNDRYLLPDSLMRGGRFEKLKIKLPAKSDGVKIIESYLKDKCVSESVSAERVSRLMRKNCCAVLEETINKAGQIAFFQGRELIEQEDLIEAYMQLEYGCKTNNLSQEKLKRIAYHEAGHALAGIWCGNKVEVVNIEQRQTNFGYCDIEDEPITEYGEFCAKVACGLGGRASIEVVYGEPDMGSKGDLYILIADILPTFIDESGVRGFEHLNRRYGNSSERADKNFNEYSRFMKEIYDKLLVVLSLNRKLLDALVELLLKKGIIFCDEIEKLVKECGFVRVKG